MVSKRKRKYFSVYLETSESSTAWPTSLSRETPSNADLTIKSWLRSSWRSRISSMPSKNTLEINTLGSRPSYTPPRNLQRITNLSKPNRTSTLRSSLWNRRLSRTKSQKVVVVRRNKWRQMMQFGLKMVKRDLMWRQVHAERRSLSNVTILWVTTTEMVSSNFHFTGSIQPVPTKASDDIFLLLLIIPSLLLIITTFHHAPPHRLRS